MIAILHNIRSLQNVGAIFRTADAAGIEKIYLCGYTPEPVDIFGNLRGDFSKTALGAEKSVEWEMVKNIGSLMAKLKSEKYKIFAIEQSGNSIAYYKARGEKRNGKGGKAQKIALVVGNEVKGLPKSVLNKCDKILEIPMRGATVKQTKHPKKTGHGKESLNVSVAFGIVTFHLISG